MSNGSCDRSDQGKRSRWPVLVVQMAVHLPRNQCLSVCVCELVGSVLDLGCGNGTDLQLRRQFDADRIAVEISLLVPERLADQGQRRCIVAQGQLAAALGARQWFEFVTMPSCDGGQSQVSREKSRSAIGQRA
jgi:hypothetical protein